jgi:hypothetical protein
VPLIVQANGIAPIFGQRTMGGGGNVEQVTTLQNTQAVLNLSRGLGTVYDPTGAYPDSRFVEDNGVTPDISYSHTLSDFRAGYVGYVAAFNAALVPPARPVARVARGDSATPRDPPWIHDGFTAGG